LQALYLLLHILQRHGAVQGGIVNFALTVKNTRADDMAFFQGEGLGNKFLSNIREVDAIVHVVRAFEDENIVHVEGSVDPVRDIETINLELILSDIEILDRRIDKTKKSLKGGDKTFRTQLEFYERLREHLESGKCARAMSMTEDELEMLADVSLLTLKPVIYAANVAEDDYAKPDGENEYVNKIREFAATENSEVMVISAKIEEEIAALDEVRHSLADLDSGLEVRIGGGQGDGTFRHTGPAHSESAFLQNFQIDFIVGKKLRVQHSFPPF